MSVVLDPQGIDISRSFACRNHEEDSQLRSASVSFEVTRKNLPTHLPASRRIIHDKLECLTTSYTAPQSLQNDQEIIDIIEILCQESSKHVTIMCFD